MAKILAVLPQSKDPTVFYRSEMPFVDLERNGHTVTEYRGDGNLCWSDIARSDIVYMQRPNHPYLLLSAEKTKEIGVPLWVDFDDDLINIPQHNPYYQTAMSGLDFMKKILELADVITVSTEHLKETLGHPEKTIVVPNAYHDRFHSYAKVLNTKRNNYIAWRGSATHKHDLAEVAPNILETNKELSDFKFLFMGYDPEFLTMNMVKDSWYFMPGSMIFSYLKKYHTLAPLISIFPLEDNNFNLCKSNISWIEASHAGSLMIAKNLPEFQKPGCITYDTPEELKDKIVYYTNNVEELLENIQLSRKYIEDNLLISKVNRKRIKMINRLTKR